MKLNAKEFTVNDMDDWKRGNNLVSSILPKQASARNDPIKLQQCQVACFTPIWVAINNTMFKITEVASNN